MTGKFIVFEGIDGCGKSTQIMMMANALRAEGLGAKTTCEPSSGHIGKFARIAREHTPEERALLFAADRLEHVRTTIKPALDEGSIVLCDRYTMSSMAYQGPDCHDGWIESINSMAIRPDLTILLTISPREAIRRIERRGNEVMEFETLEMLTRTADEYQRIRERSTDHIVHIDGSIPAWRVHDIAMRAVRGTF